MGNAHALKIKHIHDHNILKEIVFGVNNKIVPYVHYITKINKYFVENFRNGTIIKEFTILNIITGKENNIAIEHVESGYFFDGLEYSLEEIPKLDKILFISNVIEKSHAERIGVNPNSTILLGKNKPTN